MKANSASGQQKAGLWTLNAVALWLFVCIVVATVSLIFARGTNVLGVQDFRAFYSAGTIIRHHPSLLFNLEVQRASQEASAGPGSFLPFYHPAYEALLYAPFTVLSYKPAYFLYMGCNMLLLWVCYLTVPEGSFVLGRGSARPALFFLSLPLLLCIFAGQNSLFFLLILGLAYNCLLRDRDSIAGVLVGLLLFKLAIVLTLATLLVVRKGSRFLLGFLLSAGSLALLSIALTGPGGTHEYLHLLATAALASDHSLQTQRQTAVWLHAMPTISGLLYICGTRFLAAKLAFAANVGTSTVVFLGCTYLVRTVQRETVALCAALVGAILLSPHLYIYDYSALLLPILLLNHRSMKLVTAIWFLEPPVLYGIGILTWFAPAVIIPLLLLAVCFAEFSAESSLAVKAIRATEVST